jgi:hypothetical protein
MNIGSRSSLTFHVFLFRAPEDSDSRDEANSNTENEESYGNSRILQPSAKHVAGQKASVKRRRSQSWYCTSMFYLRTYVVVTVRDDVELCT